MKTIGNILWFLLGGFLLFLLWVIAGILCCVTIILIPVGLQCFKFSSLMLWPFGRTVEISGKTGHLLLNVIWVLLFGWELAVTSFFIGVLWCITIVGIPFGLQSIKFAKLALLPFGAEIHAA